MDIKPATLVQGALAQPANELYKCANCFNLLEYLRYGVIYCMPRADHTGQINDFLVVYANNTFAKLTGIEALNGAMLSEIQTHFLLGKNTLLDLAIEVIQTQLPTTHECQDRGFSKWFSINLSHIDIHNDSALVVAIEDISERKQAELDLHRMNQDFITVLESTSDFIYIKDKDSRIRYCSQTLATITGYSDWRDMVGKHDNEIFPLETAQVYIQEEIPIFRDGIAVLNKVNPYFRADGTRGWVSTNKWPMFAEDGKTVTGIFGISRDITESKVREDELRTMATTDFLTGLASRRDYIDDLNRQIARIQRAPQAVCSLLLIDLDLFKRVNDDYGHAVGDHMLQHLSRLMRNDLRRVDSIGRIGGEEFSILMPDTDAYAASTFAERLRKKIENTPLLEGEQRIPITISIGITQIHPNDSIPENVFERADIALYRAKNSGRNRVELG
jgi:diguanylate cyclase (GGDEF)-like protein/PAS domain S-box-containing protein